MNARFSLGSKHKMRLSLLNVIILVTGFGACLSQAQADIVCKAQTQMGPAQVDISEILRIFLK